MERAVLVYTTWPSIVEAERAGREIVEKRLAACVNILAPCTSLYRWHGKIEHADEVPALFKTRPMLARRLRERIAALHSYDLPVIERWTVESDAAVGEWIARETGA